MAPRLFVVRVASVQHRDEGPRAQDAHLDRIDAWLADGTLGAQPPNAADLQIAATLRLLMTIAGTTPAGALSPA